MFVLKVLGGVPRYTEMLAFAMGKLGGAIKFSWATFHGALTSDDGDKNVHSNSHYLLERVREQITIRYNKELTTTLNNIPSKQVVGYSLFEWPVTRDKIIGDYKVEDLERNGVVFLQSVDGKDTDNECKLVFPLVLLVKTLRESGMAPMLLDFQVMLSSDENERNSLKIFALKAEILQESFGCVTVGRLLPLDGSKAQTFKDIEMTFSKFTIEMADSWVSRTTWSDWFDQFKENGAMVVNAKRAPFSDMIMIGKTGNFHIHFQEKQVETAKDQKQKNLSVPNAKVEDVHEEHAKWQVDEKHLFVMITDKGVENGTELKENELLLTYDTQAKAFGSLLALLRAFNHQGQDTTTSLKRKHI